MGEGRWQEGVFHAERWATLGPWLLALCEQGLALDESTVVIVDVDKTALGARGRNHRVIDQARLEALDATVVQALGDEVDKAAFTNIYHELNQPAYHDLTGDNQDYLAYESLLCGAGALSWAELQAQHAAGAMNSFADFLAAINDRQETLPAGLRALHKEVQRASAAQDPTPFKAFRRNEYRMTVAHMGSLPDDTPAAVRAAQEICLTREVWDACRWLQKRGALIVALSDKPDEACAPDAELAAAGYRPIHKTPTHLLGEALGLD